MILAALHPDPFAATLALLAMIWLAAKAGGELAIRLKLPAVTGELATGIALSSLHRLFPLFPEVASHATADTLANLGVVVLMFAVGLESTVPQMLKVGMPSVRVAVVGVVAPMAAGLGGAWLMLGSDATLPVALFVGACLCATSIGISAQVLRERGAAKSPEGRVILGAAVIDDVLGLLVLVAVSGLATALGEGGALPWADLGRTIGLALLFLGVALLALRPLTARLFPAATRLQSASILLPMGLAFAFLLAWLGNLAGLATIVGAYAAGLILEPAHVKALEDREEHTLEAQIHPLVTVFAPIFFVVIGARIDVAALAAPRTILFAIVLALLGVVGKLLAGYVAGSGLRSAVIGWGMVPRGEVGFIFVAAGAQLRVAGAPLLSPEVEAATIGALLLTTMLGPVGLARVLARSTPVTGDSHVADR